MSLSMDLWQISDERLVPMERATLDLEKHLENWIERDISLLGIDAMIIGRQVHTSYGGFVDLLAINCDGEIILIELKRSKTPRDIVAQCLDYGTWVYDLNLKDILGIYETYKNTSLEKDFAEYYDAPIPEKINSSYQIMIVAESLDESTERIVQHLNEVHKVNINAVFFNIFQKDGYEYIGRSWLKDPLDVEERSVSGKKSKWTGYYFVNTGITEDNFRGWNLNEKYHFISAGGGSRWINAIKKLKKGDKIFALIKGKGYVGFGIVEDEATLVKNYQVNGKKIIDDLPEDHPWRQEKDPSIDEWLVRVNWSKTYPEEQGQWFKGAFANQNVVCKLRDQNTFKFLIEKFNIETTE
ncbi:MAG: hypothetical protein N0E58_19405 [Candidatus Thiodiazotropha endolucinida]|uniref:DUF91 domain-containing protein n=1 Tax=Candidatus Thiodiazotropha taylori TaxID=2792791 RepID=A0A9E4NN42_9GAMM|nr:hypothetical protein [Candidatus Thiodiazotropha taylori]MCW4238418.1 hypothetical protein [Candidatus Thiodiazotropha endolucinida]